MEQNFLVSKEQYITLLKLEENDIIKKIKKLKIELINKREEIKTLKEESDDDAEVERPTRVYFEDEDEVVVEVEQPAVEVEQPAVVENEVVDEPEIVEVVQRPVKNVVYSSGDQLLKDMTTTVSNRFKNGDISKRTYKKNISNIASFQKHFISDFQLSQTYDIDENVKNKIDVARAKMDVDALLRTIQGSILCKMGINTPLLIKILKIERSKPNASTPYSDDEKEEMLKNIEELKTKHFKKPADNLLRHLILNVPMQRSQSYVNLHISADEKPSLEHPVINTTEYKMYVPIVILKSDKSYTHLVNNNKFIIVDLVKYNMKEHVDNFVKDSNEKIIYKYKNESFVKRLRKDFIGIAILRQYHNRNFLDMNIDEMNETANIQNHQPSTALSNYQRFR